MMETVHVLEKSRNSALSFEKENIDGYLRRKDERIAWLKGLDNISYVMALRF